MAHYLRRHRMEILGVVFLVLTLSLAIIACGKTPGAVVKPGAVNYSQGNSSKGNIVFHSGCNNCHSIGTDQIVGPGLAGLFSPGGPTLPSGVNYDGNLPNGKPITDDNVAEWIHTGGQNQIGSMPPKGGLTISDQDIADIIAYLHTLKK